MTAVFCSSSIFILPVGRVLRETPRGTPQWQDDLMLAGLQEPFSARAANRVLRSFVASYTSVRRKTLACCAEFKAGASKPELAKRYGIGLKSVKKVLRAAGARKRSRYDTQT